MITLIVLGLGAVIGFHVFLVVLWLLGVVLGLVKSLLGVV